MLHSADRCFRLQYLEYIQRTNFGNFVKVRTSLRGSPSKGLTDVLSRQGSLFNENTKQILGNGIFNSGRLSVVIPSCSAR